MRVRRHYRMSISTIDSILTDLNSNRIIDRDRYFNFCVSNRVNKLHELYNNKLDKVLSTIILCCRFDDLPITILARITYSMTKVFNTLNKGLLTMIGDTSNVTGNKD